MYVVYIPVSMSDNLIVTSAQDEAALKEKHPELNWDEDYDRYETKDNSPGAFIEISGFRVV